jgi:hypothetical protein
MRERRTIEQAYDKCFLWIDKQEHPDDYDIIESDNYLIVKWDKNQLPQYIVGFGDE